MSACDVAADFVRSPEERGDQMTEKTDEHPSEAGEIARAYPAVWKAYAALGKAAAERDPLMNGRAAL